MVAATTQATAKVAYEPGSVTVAQALKALLEAEQARAFMGPRDRGESAADGSPMGVFSYRIIEGVTLTTRFGGVPAALAIAMTAVVKDLELQIMLEALERVLLEAQARMQAAGVQLVRREDG